MFNFTPEQPKKQEVSPEKPLAEKYKDLADEHGYIPLSSIRKEINRQLKSYAAFLDGDEGTGDYNYSEGLDFTGNSGNYSDMKISLLSVDEFVRRVKEHYGEI